MTELSMQALRELAAFKARSACAVSLYLDLDPSLVPTPAELDARLAALLSEAGHCGRVEGDELSNEERRMLHVDLDRIGSFFDQEFEREGTRGLALFSCYADNLWRVLTLPEAVPDTFRISRRLYLAPLVPLADARGEVMVVVAGREQGQIWSLRDGRLQLLADRFQEQPRRHDQGGWAQARYARHIDNLVHEHLRDLAAELDRRLRRQRPLALIVVAGEETRPEMDRLLSAEARRLFIGWAQANSRSSPSALQKSVQPLLERLQEQREASLIERWQEELGRAGRACGGWGQTLEAASEGRIELLFYRLGVEHEAWLCGECGWVSAYPINCPLDGTTMSEQPDGLDLLVHRTLEHGGSAVVVREHPLPPESEGIGALLRF